MPVSLTKKSTAAQRTRREPGVKKADLPKNKKQVGKAKADAARKRSKATKPLSVPDSIDIDEQGAPISKQSMQDLAARKAAPANASKLAYISMKAGESSLKSTVRPMKLPRLPNMSVPLTSLIEEGHARAFVAQNLSMVQAPKGDASAATIDKKAVEAFGRTPDQWREQTEALESAAKPLLKAAQKGGASAENFKKIQKLIDKTVELVGQMGSEWNNEVQLLDVLIERAESVKPKGKKEVARAALFDKALSALDWEQRWESGLAKGSCLLLYDLVRAELLSNPAKKNDAYREAIEQQRPMRHAVFDNGDFREHRFMASYERDRLANYRRHQRGIAKTECARLQELMPQIPDCTGINRWADIGRPEFTFFTKSK